MEFDRDIARARERSNRDEAEFDPGKRSNTDRMQPAAAAGPNRLYQKPSPLGGGGSEPPAPPTFKLEAPPDKAAPQDQAAAQASGAQPAAASTSAPPAARATASPSASTAASHSASSAASEKKLEGGDGTPSPRAHPARTPASAPRGTATATLQSHTLATASADPSDARTTVGVGEDVRIVAPSGSGTFTATAATGDTTGAGNEWVWRAPDVAGSVTITFTPTSGAAQTKNFTVVAPTDIRFTKETDVPQPPAGAGMRTNLHIGPQTVSFANAEWLEEEGPPSAVDGYFTQLRLQARRDLQHRPTTRWNGMSDGHDTNNGVDDSAFIGDLPRLYRSPTQVFGGNREYFDGSFQWDIPNKYRVTGQGSGHPFTTTHQRFTINSAGSVTVSKGGVSSGQNAQGMVDPTGRVLEPFADTDAALSRLFWGDRSGDARKAILYGLNLLTTYRMNDSASYTNLLAALNQITAYFYVSVRCENSYSLMSDDLEINVSGTRNWQQTTTISSDSFRQNSIPWTQIIDPATFGSQSSVRYQIRAERHEFNTSHRLPFDGYTAYENLPGADGRYRLRAILTNTR